MATAYIHHGQGDEPRQTLALQVKRDQPKRRMHRATDYRVRDHKGGRWLRLFDSGQGGYYVLMSDDLSCHATSTNCRRVRVSVEGGTHISTCVS